MADIIHEAQDTHLCALFIGAHGDTGDYEYALDAANSAAKHLQVILAELPATSPLARDAGILAKSSNPRHQGKHPSTARLLQTHSTPGVYTCPGA